MIITVLLLCTFLILICHYLIHHGRFWQLIDQIPGPQPLLLIGNALMSLTVTSLENLFEQVEKYGMMYYPILKIWSFNLALVAISHPDDVEKILCNTKDHIGKGVGYIFLYPWLGTGLLTSEGAKWHSRRKLLKPAFHFNMLRQYVNILIKEGNYMTKCLKKNNELIVNDLASLISNHTLNAISETAMGTKLKEMGDFQEKYREAVHEINQIITARLVKPWYYSDVIFKLSPMGRKQAKNLKILHGFTEKIIAERKEYHKSSDGQYLKQFENYLLNDDEEITGIRKKLSMLDILIAASYDNKLSDADIREEVDTFMFEGHDTVAMSICFTILLLAEHKDIQDCVRSEVSAVRQECNGELTMTALNNMPYLERCLKESLRLYPSVPHISRITTADVKLQSYTVPPGVLIGIPIHIMHKHPDFWPNPNVFDPDRFLPENIQNRHPFCYLPFSAGSRNCIGQRFAMLELKAIIAPLVHNFYLEPISYLRDLRFRADLVLRTVQPLRVKFIPIEQV